MKARKSHRFLIYQMSHTRLRSNPETSVSRPEHGDDFIGWQTLSFGKRPPKELRTIKA
jgi:hypothetical protein